MKPPFILITYGFSKKLFTYEEEGAHKLPIFGEASLASLFINSARHKMEEFLEEQSLQIQICGKIEHAIDMFKMIAIVNPEVTIFYNAAPLVDDPQEAIGKIAGQFESLATIINREYTIDDWITSLEDQSESSGSSE